MSGFLLLTTVSVLGTNIILAQARLDSLKTVDDYMNICLDGEHQKSVPGPELGLVKELCSPWAERSCCSAATARGVHMDRRWLNFDWDHCKTLSPRCREYFLMDLCFYECSPNVGPWLVEDVRKIRNERFRDVPICKSDCENWWEACHDDYTCLDNWATGFDWSSGINTCPQESSCRPFHQVYSNSSDFCQTLMGGSFRVADNEQDCFYLWFDPTYGNPNEAVARKKASEILNVTYKMVSHSSNHDSGNGAANTSGLTGMVLSAYFFHVLTLRL
ncbi:folate receptor beta [Aplysia californica]|uniref:Folate receptor beta n=1 Tax=Aplysia californica TaxID=6500 RepID=A0ABM0K3M5_APLCA|nr:folate receptor beta [Aplysia californica]